MTMAFTYLTNKDFPSAHHSTARNGDYKSLIAGARQIHPDDHSRRTKLITARKIWTESRSAQPSIVELYLNRYGLKYDRSLIEKIRFHSSVLHEPTRQFLPAMITAVQNLDKEFVGIHRTYLASDGGGRAKVREGEALRMLGACYGSHIQICTTRSTRIVVTEGVEMAIGIHQSCPELSVWSAMKLGNMKSPVHASFKEIVLCTDGYNKDHKTAHKILMDAVREHMSRGLTVFVAQSLPGMDFSDVLRMG